MRKEIQRMKQFSLLWGVIILLWSADARADYPLQLAFWPPKLQLLSDTESVRGLRLDLYGRNMDMKGLDLGLVNETGGDFAGFGVGLVNLVDGNMRGVQLSYYGYQRVGGSAYGWSYALVSRVKEDFQGMQQGAVSMTYKDFKGVQASIIYSYTGEELTGAQLGFVNQASAVHGLQLGIINFTERMRGLQIGLWNQINEKENLRVFPFVNWKF